MGGLLVMKIINFFSLVFTILNVIFLFDSGISNSGLIFIWVITVNTGVCFIKDERIKKATCVFLVLLPILLKHNMGEAAFILILSALSIIFINKRIIDYNYGNFLDSFKTSLGILTFLIFVILATFNFTRFGNIIAPYLAIYLISSVIILRTMRLSEHAKDDKTINKLNARYSIAIIIVSLVLSIEAVRKAVFMMLSIAYNGITNVIVFVFTILFLPLAHVLQVIIDYILNLLKKVKFKGVKGSDYSPIPIKKYNSEDFLKHFLDSSAFHVILWILIGAIAAYIIFRIFRTRNSREEETEYFEEEREFIRRKKEGGHLGLKAVTGLIPPRDNREYVRFYYIKYLRLCIKNRILFGAGDTSYDINSKAVEKFNAKNTKNLRETYIKARYDCSAVDKEMREKIRDSFRKIK